MSEPRALTGLSSMKLALLAQQARAQAEHVLKADPIAIVGMGCRVPGASSPSEFWTLLRSGRDVIREVPADRWNAADWYDADSAQHAKSVTKFGGFLDAVDGFDADYFGILPREADRMDPQQRLFLEVAIEALDDAGATRESLEGSRTGVYIASYHNDYAQMQYGDVDAIDARTLTGTLHSVLANRLSFMLDLRGPSISIDTACSSSLVAIHLACQSVRFGESDVAVAGGVSLMLAPELLVSMSKVGFMSPDGRCKSFDESADGFGRGEGCGVVILKRLSDAISDGDRVLAVVRGSAVNQDGHSTLLAAPHGPAQEALIRSALANAQLEPGRIGYVEAHGTGTALGDPIEVEAIAAAVGRVTNAGPCLLGSAKSSIGHLEAAAGVTGLIKSVLALRHEEVPPQANFTRLSRHISLAGTRLRIPTLPEPWVSGAVPRCASVSSFGVGGTNAHVIVEEAPKLAGDADVSIDTPFVLPLSAHSEPGLVALATSWIPFLAESRDSMRDICHTASVRRTRYDRRLVVVAETRDAMVTHLREFLYGRTTPFVAHGRRRSASPPRLAFVFSGQGPQWQGMGRELFEREPAFRAAIERCDTALHPHSGWSLIDEFARTEAHSRLEQTIVAQPAIFAMQVALAALWKSWGVVPHAIAGHSVGEIAALYVAGAIDLETAAKVVWHRGRIMQDAMGLGRMASVALSEAEIAPMLRNYGDRLSVGALNAPRSLVLSGDSAALEDLLAKLATSGVSHRMLPVQYAFHSAQMAPFERQLAHELAGIRTEVPSIPFFSTVTGAVHPTPVDAAYFGHNVRAQVRFSSAIAAMADSGCNVFLEIAPHPVLGASIGECLADRSAEGGDGTEEATVVSTLRRGRPDVLSTRQAVAAIHAAGCDVDWTMLAPESGSVVTLPAYPWQRRRHWLRARPQAGVSGVGTSTGHPLLGVQLSLAGVSSVVYEGNSEGESDWLHDHIIFGLPLLPATAVLELFGAAAGRHFGSVTASIANFAMDRPVALPARWQLVVTPSDEASAELALFEAVDAEGVIEWRAVASAVGISHASGDAYGRWNAASGNERTVVQSERIYAAFAASEIAFGPAFRRLTRVSTSEQNGTRVAEGMIDVDALGDASYGLHPALCDAALQLCSVAAGITDDVVDAARAQMAFLPVGAERVSWSGVKPQGLRAHVTLTHQDVSGFVADVVVANGDGSIVVRVDGMRFVQAEMPTIQKSVTTESPMYEVAWEHAPRRAGATEIGEAALSARWLVLADAAGVGDALIARVSRAGGTPLTVRAGHAFRRIGVHEWEIDPTEPRDFAKLLQAVRTGGAVGGVVHAWNVDAPDVNELSSNTADADDERGVASILHLVQALSSGEAPAFGRLWIVTRGAEVCSDDEPAVSLRPSAAGAVGLAGVIALEHPELCVAHVDLDPSAAADDVGTLVMELCEVRAPDPRVALRGESRLTPVLVSLSKRKHADPAHGFDRLEVANTGTIDGVAVRRIERSALERDQIRVHTRAAGLNFRDVLLALGMYPGEGVPLGAEFSGSIVECGSNVTQFRPGDEVFGYARASLSTEIVVPATFCARVPKNVPATDAAGLAVAFLTASLGLERLAGLKRGQRVLIHAAAGGVGMAAVQIAQRCGAEIFATAGSDEKRARLRELGVMHVMDSRTLAFADDVLAKTNGHGVDVVLNSLAGDFIAASVRTLAKGGCLLELGKRDVMSPRELARIRPDVRYFAYDLGSDAEADHALLPPMLTALVAALEDGTLRPLPTTVFAYADARSAMRFMAQARHTGKIVIRMPAAQAFPATSALSSDHTYLVTGGLGALGLETARWLALRGARHLLLTSRRPATDGAIARISQLQADGVAVRVEHIDVADRDGMAALFAECARDGHAVRGIVHAAGTLHDGILVSQRWPQAKAVLRGKWHGALVLHELTRDLPLDFFILYSAAGAWLGASGQGLYAAANARLDALAAARRRNGQATLSVAWGAWDRGMAATASVSGHDQWQGRGLMPLSSELAFRSLDALLDRHCVSAAVVRIDWARFIGALPPGVSRKFFARVMPATERVAQPRVVNAPQRQSIPEQLSAVPVGVRRAALARLLASQALLVLGLDPASPVDARAALKDIGLDSLMAVELRNTLNRGAPKTLPATLLFDYPTLDALTDYVARAWQIDVGASKQAVATKPGATASGAVVAGVDVNAMSDEEAEAMLLAELERGASGGAR